MKKLATIFCAALLTLLPLHMALAQTSPTAILTPGSTKYQMNQQTYTMTTAPFDQNSKIYAPIDILAQTLGVDQSNSRWDMATGQINLIFPGQAHYTGIKMQVNSRHAVIESLISEKDPADQTKPATLRVFATTAIDLGAPPQIKQQQIYLPVRQVASLVGFEVTWDKYTKSVFLTAPKININDNAPVGDGEQNIAGIMIKTNEVKDEINGLELNLQLPVISGLTDKVWQKQVNQQILAKAEQIQNGLKQNFAELEESAKISGFTVPAHQLFINYEAFTCGDILSLVVETYQYSGGAHGSTHKDFYNIDTKNNKLLALSDLFKPNTDYFYTINQYIQKQIDAQKQAGESMYFEGDNGFTSIKENHSFYIKDNQLILHFAQYEIAPYVAGMPEFAVPFTVLNHQLHKDFIKLLPPAN